MHVNTVHLGCALRTSTIYSRSIRQQNIDSCARNMAGHIPDAGSPPCTVSTMATKRIAESAVAKRMLLARLEGRSPEVYGTISEQRHTTTPHKKGKSERRDVDELLSRRSGGQTRRYKVGRKSQGTLRGRVDNHGGYEVLMKAGWSH